MKKSRVSISPTTTQNPHTATGKSYRNFFRKFEDVALAEIPAKFNSDKDRDGHLTASRNNNTVEIKAENSHIVATFYQYE